MEVLIVYVIAIILHITFSLETGLAAVGLRRKFWPWFFVGLLLPLIGLVIILCLPRKQRKVQQPLLKPVSSEEIFDQELELDEQRRINGSEIQFMARA